MPTTGAMGHTALVVGPSQLLRKASQRGAVKKVAHGVGRHVEGVVCVAHGVDEPEWGGPRPTEAL